MDEIESAIARAFMQSIDNQISSAFGIPANLLKPIAGSVRTTLRPNLPENQLTIEALRQAVDRLIPKPISILISIDDTLLILRELHKLGYTIRRGSKVNGIKTSMFYATYGQYKVTILVDRFQYLKRGSIVWLDKLRL